MRYITRIFAIAATLCLIAFVGCKKDTDTAAPEGEQKWVVGMEGVCTDSMVKDAKEEMSAGHSEFDEFCVKGGLKTAVDAKCENGNLMVQCK
ncbi:MAG: hypothetical protein JXA20_06545 [Spirochaetes bacterium]|nr:hypothetical protein [Spirochaetota bacterium]